MEQVTDQAHGTSPDVTGDPADVAGRVLAAAADHFTTVDPALVLGPQSLLICISVAAYDLAGRSLYGVAQVMAGAAFAAAPEMPEGITRSECADLLREAAKACGYAWDGDDNERVIPIIPRPRREPDPYAVPPQRQPQPEPEPEPEPEGGEQ